jgi:Cu/Ag efflux protein CusF
MASKPAGIIFIAGLLCMAASFAVRAAGQEATPARELPAVAAGAVIVVTATVEAIDMQSREVALRYPDGLLEVLVVGEEARNLDQVRIGDLVRAEYRVGMIVALSPAEDGVRERTDTVSVGRSEPGQKPAGIVRNTVRAKGVVLAVDQDARTVKLQGALRIVTLPVAEDIDLSQIKVGDTVHAAYEESVAISVQPAAAQP